MEDTRKEPINVETIVDEGSSFEEPVRLYRGSVTGSSCSIGRYTYIRNNSALSANVTVGRFCSIGSNVTIGSVAHPIDRFTTHPFTYEGGRRFPGSELEGVAPLPVEIGKETHIGNDCWIGDGAMILGGISVGDGVVIGMGAIITKDIDPYCVVVGHNRVLRKRFSDDNVARWMKVKWWNWSVDEIANIPKLCAEEALDYCEKFKIDYEKR